MKTIFVGSLVVNEEGRLVFMISADLKEASPILRRNLFDACSNLFAQASAKEAEFFPERHDNPNDALPCDTEPAE